MFDYEVIQSMNDLAIPVYNYIGELSADFELAETFFHMGSTSCRFLRILLCRCAKRS